MKLTGLHIFLILLASIVFCACLGDDKKIIEGAVGGMDLEDADDTGPVESRRHDHIRKERRKKQISDESRRELENYNHNKNREIEKRLSELEKHDRKQQKMIERYKRRISEENDYDRHEEIYKRMNEEKFHVDDHRHKRRTRNRARMSPMSRKGMLHPDKYMLKSEVVPPVCPACPGGKGGPPGGSGGNNDSTPAPCPPCARCPEPAFECKKVPNYNSTNTSNLPKPVLSDFSTFAM